MRLTEQTLISLPTKQVTVEVLERALTILRKHGTVVIDIYAFEKQDSVFGEVPTLAEVLFQ